jgi:diaminohydroxyphosphoribosylaminopyrimidine deaminase/5-amino-6-(5-phosphoribosylamino)uracil reductase
MSRTLDLPADANLWNTDSAPTIVMTQRGARQSFQSLLRSKGVEVVEFDFLTPENVADYCYERGFLQVRGAKEGQGRKGFCYWVRLAAAS